MKLYQLLKITKLQYYKLISSTPCEVQNNLVIVKVNLRTIKVLVLLPTLLLGFVQFFVKWVLSLVHVCQQQGKDYAWDREKYSPAQSKPECILGENIKRNHHYYFGLSVKFGCQHSSFFVKIVRHKQRCKKKTSLPIEKLDNETHTHIHTCIYIYCLRYTKNKNFKMIFKNKLNTCKCIIYMSVDSFFPILVTCIHSSVFFFSINIFTALDHMIIHCIHVQEYNYKGQLLLYLQKD